MDIKFSLQFSGIIFCPFICLVITIGNSAIILGLWPVHVILTYYSIVRWFFLPLILLISFLFSYLVVLIFVAFFLTNDRAKQFGPILKFVLCVGVSVPLILWPVVAIGGSILGGAAYGFLAPLMATFDAVGEGKANDFIHCLYVWLRFPVHFFWLLRVFLTFILVVLLKSAYGFVFVRNCHGLFFFIKL